MQYLRFLVEKKQVLVIGKVWPEPASSAAGMRMMQLIAFFKEQDYKVHFCSAAKPTPYSVNLNEHSIDCSEILLNDASFDDFVKKLQPAITLFDRFTTEEQFGWRVHQKCPDSFLLLDTEDLHSLRANREQALKKKNESSLLSDITIRELSSILRCDASIIISQTELQLLCEEFSLPKHLLLYLPLLNDAPQGFPLKDFDERNHFISLGNFLHAPNKDSVLYLRDVIWPLIHKQLPQAKMQVYGAYADEAVMQWSQPKSNFFVLGRAESAEEVMQSARVCLAPLRFGAGQKGKLVLAMQCKTPSVTTSIGAESMCNKDQWPGFVCDDPHDFADKAVALYQSKTTWQLAQAKCDKALEAFDKHTHLQQFKIEFDALQKNYHVNRTKNIAGQLLRYHANHSTRYMALWIEAKNKLNT